MKLIECSTFFTLIAKDEIIFIFQDDDNNPDINQLLTEHMVKWIEVRKSWKNAANMNEKRFSQSMKILNEMFEK